MSYAVRVRLYKLLTRTALDRLKFAQCFEEVLVIGHFAGR